MHARLVLVEIAPGRRELAEKVAERWGSAVATLPGFVDAWFLIDDESGEYGLFSLWQTKEDADSVPEQTGPMSVREMVEDMAANPPVIKVFHVYEPRSFRTE